MLEYVKVILQKVSFDTRLFEKELKKSITYLKGREIDALREWCYRTFYASERHAEVLEGCFELT
ncbi:MAG: hypothetical protein EAZ95_02800 [Bacteroidetes bacterium]|nr:MAG: hypothetical protein EAZ95_02800 [Bacteroidota bacterium]